MNLNIKIIYNLIGVRQVVSSLKLPKPNNNLNLFHKNTISNGFVRNVSSANLMKSSSVQLKKRPFKKKKVITSDSEGITVSAFSTAEEFDLDGLSFKLNHDLTYRLSDFNGEFGDSHNVIHMVPNNQDEVDPKDIFIFREGSVVFWNFSKDEIPYVLKFLKLFQKNSFAADIVQNENETISCIRSPESIKTTLKNGKVILPMEKNDPLEKFAISNAMALSVLLGAYESLLNDYIESMESVTEDLKSGKFITITQDQVLRKMGHLFSLRHVINLSSDLLDTPDFYWDREELEKLYQITFNYFWISRRTKVMNEKINHCIELVELLSTQLSDRHHIRLEWMIIILIMVEVGFEFLHYSEKYWT